MGICVIFNPAARGEKAKRFRDHLAELSRHCVLKPTAAPGTGRSLAADAVREGCDLVVAAGGDGTVNEVLNGIGDEPDGFLRARLGVLPLGTVNVFAKELRLPSGLRAAWDIIERGRAIPIDVADAEFAVQGRPQHRYFVQMAGAGVDSRAIELVDWHQKKRMGILAYIAAGAKAMSGPKPQVAVTDGKESLSGEQVLIGNGRFYGGRFALFPVADLQDGVLEVSVLPKATWGSLLRGSVGLLLGQLYTTGGVRHLKAASIQLSSTLPVAFQVEGENVGHLPASISVCPRLLRVVVP